jgi:hypothetical protein
MARQTSWGRPFRQAARASIVIRMSKPPINLNKTRKERLKAETNSKAAMNRIAFGRTKAEKKAEMIRKSKAAKALDGAKREP